MKPVTGPKIGMPKACISCTQYQHSGYDQDEHCPFPKRFASSDKPTKTEFGDCLQHGVEVFATQICSNYDPEPHVVPAPVENRPCPRIPIQQDLVPAKTNIGASHVD